MDTIREFPRRDTPRIIDAKPTGIDFALRAAPSSPLPESP